MLSVNNYRRTGPGLSLNYINQLDLENFLESDLQMFLRPFTFTRYILFTNRYRISCNFITPNNRKTNCFSFICSFCFVIIYGIAIYIDYIYENSMQTVLWAFFLMSHIILIFVHIINSIVNALQSENHVNFILNIQRLQRSLKLVTISYRGLIFVNWIYVLGFLLIYVLLTLTYVYLESFSSTSAFCYITLLLLDLNIIYLIRVNKLLVYSIESWMSELKLLDEKCWNDNIEDAVGYKQHLVQALISRSTVEVYVQ
ncbi:uncharacterized protein [Battus philenor]|uniref:uncharacterized protein n=1 Tax=Battus philenor TaxID=42288 RepID=UPI0035D1303D